MAAAVPSRLGQSNLAGDAKALFLKVFSGEVLTAFHRENKFLERSMVRTIQNGKSAQFPTVGTVTAAYHTPGAELTGGVVAHAERVISIDDLLVAQTFIANIDEAMNHYDVRSTYSEEGGKVLSETMDSNLAQVGLLAARASATITGGSGGSVLINAAYDSDSAVLASGIFSGMQTLDEKNVGGERSVFVRPAQYYLLAQNTTLINQWYGGQGAIAEGTVLKVAGAEVVKTNGLPSTNITTGVATYQGNFSTSVALIMNKGAIGTVKLMDLATESEYQINRQGTLIVSKYAIGHGIVRPECAVELKTA
jgi:hypothetical protein|tara:strand:+ start:25 stop:948 length:924 start_codon:yes stop_codon:yes gene_type:complete